MKKLFSLVTMLLVVFMAQAQLQEVKLQASGLTCSMCSKAVLNALQKVSFVAKVDVDIDKQEYGITFKQDAGVELDALAKAVEDAGFSVAKLNVTAKLAPQKAGKDEHVLIGGQTFHFLNAAGQQLSETVRFQLADKAFVSEKEFKNATALSTMSCVKTGRMEACCTKNGAASERVYHALL